MVSAASAFIGWELAIGVYLAFEASEERFAGRAGAGAVVCRACPGGFGGYPCVDVLTHGAITSAAVTDRDCPAVFLTPVVRAFTCRYARGVRQRQRVRQSLIVSLVGGGRAKASAADLDGAPGTGVLSEAPVQGRPTQLH